MYMVMSRDQKTGQNHNLGTANEVFDKVTKFKYVGMTIKNQTGFIKKLRSD